MSIQSEIIETRHTLHYFDGELNELHSLLLKMINLLVLQFDEVMQALDDGDINRAEQVIIRDNTVNQYELTIDDETLTVLARECPVAGDLRNVISITKIADELEKTGDEIGDFARMIIVLFDPKTSDPNAKVLKDIFKLGNIVKLMLDKCLQVIETGNISHAYVLMQYNNDCENVLQKGIEHQLNFIMEDARLIGRSLDIMQMMKTLERCGEYCRNIAEYMIYMIEGVDIRHQDQAVLEKMAEAPL